MKKVLSILIISLTIGLTESCEKFLTVNPPYTQDVENFFQSPEDYNRALTGAYDMLQGSFMTLWIGEIASDNAIAGGESVNDSQGLHQIDNMTHGGVNNELRNVFVGTLPALHVRIISLNTKTILTLLVKNIFWRRQSF